MFAKIRTRLLAALTLTTDLLIVVCMLPLERASIIAMRQDSSIQVLSLLLFGNFALLALIGLSMTLNSALIARIVRKFAHGDRES